MILLAFLSGLIAHAQAIKLTAKFTDQELSTDPNAAIWAQAPTATVTLGPQQIAAPFGGGAIKELHVRVLHNGRQIAFLTEWADATPDRESAQVDRFSDAVALQFPYQSDAQPSPFMGDARHAVNIWQWQAAWQRDIDEGGLADVDRAYPPYASEVPYGIYVGRDVGNWRSQRDHKTPIENLIAQGWGTLTHQEQQHVLGKGVWENGRWKVVFLRALQTGLMGDASFIAGQKLSVNFAVWDGAQSERGARKSVSLFWHELQLDPLPAGFSVTAEPIKSVSTTQTVGVPAWAAALVALLALLFGALLMWFIMRPRSSQEPEIG
ncbi:MAG: ethylbenzene dehydrogenase-related protein [Candidatus Bipolaricaulota bacterium]|nr:ethylbenzene dehydrogenase-related protein [Candidatus Bipolaricaulota bacterium]MDW8140686.1 ethylbenzene dehydrogenase-related protein [Candidatus Bipolaricaulota bacterium]